MQPTVCTKATVQTKSDENTHRRSIKSTLSVSICISSSAGQPLSEKPITTPKNTASPQR